MLRGSTIFTGKISAGSSDVAALGICGGRALLLFRIRFSETEERKQDRNGTTGVLRGMT